MKMLLVILALTLASCATAPQRVVDVPPTTVPVIVAASCVADLPPPMDYPDTDTAMAAASNIFVKAQLVMAGRKMRIQREIELNIALAGCAGRVSK